MPYDDGFQHLTTNNLTCNVFFILCSPLIHFDDLIVAYTLLCGMDVFECEEPSYVLYFVLFLEVKAYCWPRIYVRKLSLRGQHGQWTNQQFVGMSFLSQFSSFFLSYFKINFKILLSIFLLLFSPSSLFTFVFISFITKFIFFSILFFKSFHFLFYFYFLLLFYRFHKLLLSSLLITSRFLSFLFLIL